MATDIPSNLGPRVPPVKGERPTGQPGQLSALYFAAMELLEGLLTRRSVRAFTPEPVSREQVLEILRAGSWAPSGLNNQPWRFAIVFDAAVRGRLAQLTRYGRIIEAAPVCLAVFMDREVGYHEVKDHQSIGACIENLLLAAHGLGLGLSGSGRSSGAPPKCATSWACPRVSS